MWEGGPEKIQIFLINPSLKSVGESVSIVDTRYGLPNTGSFEYTVQRFNPGTYEFQIGDATSGTFQVVYN